MEIDEDSRYSLLEPVARAELLERQLLTTIVERHDDRYDDMGCYFHEPEALTPNLTV